MMSIAFQTIEDPTSADMQAMMNVLIDFNEKITGSKRKALFIGAHINTNCVGGIHARWRGADAYIDHLAVVENHRSQGAGRSLINSVEAELKRRGCKQIFVNTYAFQAPEFYKRLGYELVSRIREYMCGHDQFTFRKFLSGISHD